MTTTKTPVVAILGSTKFKEQMQGIAQRETLRGKIVLLPGFYHHRDHVPITPEQKEMLDELMLRKVELADEVVVCNVNGYLGETTKRGIKLALSLNKEPRFEYGDHAARVYRSDTTPPQG